MRYMLQQNWVVSCYRGQGAGMHPAGQDSRWQTAPSSAGDSLPSAGLDFMYGDVIWAHKRAMKQASVEASGAGCLQGCTCQLPSVVNTLRGQEKTSLAACRQRKSSR